MLISKFPVEEIHVAKDRLMKLIALGRVVKIAVWVELQQVLRVADCLDSINRAPSSEKHRIPGDVINFCRLSNKLDRFYIRMH